MRFREVLHERLESSAVDVRAVQIGERMSRAWRAWLPHSIAMALAVPAWFAAVGDITRFRLRYAFAPLPIELLRVRAMAELRRNKTITAYAMVDGHEVRRLPHDPFTVLQRFIDSILEAFSGIIGLDIGN
jgi:hypothetical protein